jgi:hypothetical protein
LLLRIPMVREIHEATGFRDANSLENTAAKIGDDAL